MAWSKPIPTARKAKRAPPSTPGAGAFPARRSGPRRPGARIPARTGPIRRGAEAESAAEKRRRAGAAGALDEPRRDEPVEEGSGSRPIMAKPRTTTRSPAIARSSSRFSPKRLPAAAAAAPRATKTPVKPATKGRLAATTRRPPAPTPGRRRRRGSRGTSGRTQGVANETSPATNASGTFASISRRSGRAPRRPCARAQGRATAVRWTKCPSVDFPAASGSSGAGLRPRPRSQSPRRRGAAPRRSG